MIYLTFNNKMNFVDLFRKIVDLYLKFCYEKLPQNQVQDQDKVLRGVVLFSVCTFRLACVQTLLISFQRGSPPVESAHRRPNPCSEPRAIPSLEEPSH